ETVAPADGAVIETDGGVVSVIPVLSAVLTTSNVVVPSVQINPIWPPTARGKPEMKLRVWVLRSVPGTVAHPVHVPPINALNRIELAGSLLMQNSQTLVPSVAPNTPAPPFGTCPEANAGGGAFIAFHVFDAGT